MHFSTIDFIGNLIFLAGIITIPFVSFREYNRSPQPRKRALIGFIVIALLAISAVIGGILFITNLLRVKNATTFFVFLPLDFEFLVYWWTSPSKKWTERRSNRRSRLLLIVGTCLLILGLILLLLNFFS